MKKLNADIVVLSAGTAGLPAALTAAQGGARVIILEKAGRTGGTASRANSIFAIGSKLQKANPPAMTLEEAFNTHMEYTHWRVDAKLVNNIFSRSGSTIDWLQEQGVEFNTMGGGGPPSGGAGRPPAGGPGGPGGPRGPSSGLGFKGEPMDKRLLGQAHLAMKILTEKARKAGVKIYLKTPAKKILKKGGRIVGVVAEDSSGEEVRVDARAVIVATGGFSSNKEWVKKYTGWEDGKNYCTIAPPGLTGDGIRMAWEVGAAATPMYIGTTHNLPPPCHGAGGASPQFSHFAQSYNIMVNLFGERFANEDFQGAYSTVGGHGAVTSPIRLQKERMAFTIFDDGLKKYYDEQAKNRPQMGGGMFYAVFKGDDLDDRIREAWDKGIKQIWMADSLEDLCAQTGIDHEGLKKTIAEYNKMCESGKDTLFFKNSRYLKPLNGAKFYAGQYLTGAYGTVGGIKTNEKMEVMTEDFNVIPGLYAAGNDANNMYDFSYTPLAGNYMNFAFTSGRIAAENAVAYIKAAMR